MNIRQERLAKSYDKIQELIDSVNRLAKVIQKSNITESDAERYLLTIKDDIHNFFAYMRDGRPRVTLRSRKR